MIAIDSIPITPIREIVKCVCKTFSDSVLCSKMRSSLFGCSSVFPDHADIKCSHNNSGDILNDRLGSNNTGSTENAYHHEHQSHQAKSVNGNVRHRNLPYAHCLKDGVQQFQYAQSDNTEHPDLQERNCSGHCLLNRQEQSDQNLRDSEGQQQTYSCVSTHNYERTIYNGFRTLDILRIVIVSNQRTHALTNTHTNLCKSVADFLDNTLRGKFKLATIGTQKTIADKITTIQ